MSEDGKRKVFEVSVIPIHILDGTRIVSVLALCKCALSLFY